MPDEIPFGSPPIGSNNSPDSLPFGAAPIGPVQTPKEWTTNPALEHTGRVAAQAISGIEKGALNAFFATPIQAVAKMFGQKDPFINDPMIDITGNPIPFSDLSRKGLMEKAGDAASTALLGVSPEAKGIVALGALGGAQGVAQSVSSGSDPFSSEGRAAIQKDAGKGILFGGILGMLGHAAGAIATGEKYATGIDPAMEKELSRARPETLKNYIDTAVSSSKDYQAPTVDSLIMADIQKGADLLDTKVLDKAGKAVGDAHRAAANIPIMSVPSGSAPVAGAGVADVLRDQINEKIRNITGHEFSYSSAGDLQIGKGTQAPYPEGPDTSGLTVGDEEHAVVPMAGRPAAELEPSEEKSLSWLSKQLAILKESPKVQTASDIVSKLDKKIDWARIREYGAKSSPVDSILQQARGMINGVIRPAAPDLAAANDAYGPLAQAKQALIDAAGKDLDHLDLLTRRVIYSGQSEGAQSVLDVLNNAVKPYLPKDEESYITKAIIARFARDTFSGKIGQTGFAQGMSTNEAAGFAGARRSITQSALKFAKRSLSPDPAQYAMSIAKGEPYSFIPFVHRIDEFLDSDSSTAITQSFKDGLKELGVSSSNVGSAAKAILRVMLMQQITRPNSVANPTAADSTIPFMAAPLAPEQTQASARPLNAPMSESDTKSLSAAGSGQAMAAQSRKLGLGAMPNGMNLSKPGLTIG